MWWGLASRHRMDDTTNVSLESEDRIDAVVVTRVTGQVRAALERAAVAEGRTASSVIRQALLRYLAEWPGAPRPATCYRARPKP